ncbi:MAG: leucine--tRNA ligase [Deltaproteobacteria bacterium]|nr:leucine--tRNA ligase [Deltaproteobacteria bacterium]
MTETKYQPDVIEPKWQKAWEAAKLFQATEDSAKKKYYLLEMLPYPSGVLHMGHVRNYSIGDVAARYKMMQGHSVLHPMAWDAFGMPAENAAIKHGVHPAKWTRENIDYMRSQLRRLGFSYDWNREFATCDPSYYRWEQLIFLKMLERKMVYRKTSLVNWCPSCETVLANEQAEGGVCWRCEASVEMKSMTQWYFRITDYAEELLRDIDLQLGSWPERIRTIQRGWIGKSEGATIDFELVGAVREPPLQEKITVFTTRPDTLFGVTFVSLASNHPLVAKLSAGTPEAKKVQDFVERSARIDHQARLAEKYEKEGVFVGAYCKHPLTGENIPIYAANFVVMEYGTGAVMAVPAHDQRDFEFAKKYNLPIKVVIQPGKNVGAVREPPLQQAYADEGVLIDSGEFTGLSSRDAMAKISAALGERGQGGPTVTYKLKDWCLSRQRYWGAPIPIVYCDVCGPVPVPEKDLPVLLPEDVPFTGTGGSPLAKSERFLQTSCPTCHGKANRVTDTMDTFVESSWYFFRYTSPGCDRAAFDAKKVAYWFPIDLYIGGVEHAAGHLIYCRYYTKVLRDLGMLKLDEPVVKLINQGMVIKGGAKMSKSKGNVVDPDDLMAKYGADTMRLFSLFAAPVEGDLEWSNAGIEGAWRFLNRVWRLVQGWCKDVGAGLPRPYKTDDIIRLQHHTIKRVTEDLERYHYNTAIAAIMEYLNALSDTDVRSLPASALETLVILLAPFAPHMAEELWRALGHQDFLVRHPWPSYDAAVLQSSTLNIVVQVNGKLRDQVSVPADATEDDVKKVALASPKVAAHVTGAPKKVIYVPKKLINIVV